MNPAFSSNNKNFRAVINNDEIAASASKVLSSLGLKEPFHTDFRNHSANITERAELRNVLHTVRNSVDLKKPETITNDVLNTVEYLNAKINLISNQIDLEEVVDAQFSGQSSDSTAVRDVDGRRIGTFLSNKTLQSPGKIAQHLNVHQQESCDGAETGSANIADFFRGVANMKTRESVRNTLSVGTNTSGGYTVPSVLLPNVLNALVPASSLLGAGANIVMLEDGATNYRIAAVDTLPSAAWRSENDTVAESDATFRAIDIVPRSLSFMFKISRELLADSGDIEQVLNIAIAAAFAKELDRAGLRGSGTAPEIKGLLNMPNVNAVAFGGANGAKPTNYSGFVTAWQSIVTANAREPNASIMHPRDMATFANLADSTGQPLQRPPLLDSMRFYQTPQIPTNITTGTSSDTSEIYIGDFSQFTFYMREGVSVQLAPTLYAATGQIGFFCHTRVDVAVTYGQAFAVLKGIRP